ncbi:hypothetical protein ABB02_01782 [Clostridiaceae bacterium JG1575]|nr:hypothetical protein ABB02_01782 [Clostridiaceae bacterium JG1575]
MHWTKRSPWGLPLFALFLMLTLLALPKTARAAEASSELSEPTLTLPAAGGEAVLHLTVKNAVKSEISYRFIRVFGSEEIEYNGLQILLEGEQSPYALRVPLPENTKKTPAVYRLYARAGQSPETVSTLTVAAPSADFPQDLFARASLCVDQRTLMVVFEGAVTFAQSLEEVRANLRIQPSLFKEPQPLAPGDRVILEGDTLTLHLQESLDAAAPSLRIPEGLLTHRGRPLSAKTLLIAQAVPTAHRLETVGDVVFDWRGGTAKAKIIGENLGKSTVGHVLALGSPWERPLPVRVEGSGKEQLLSFSMPPNFSDRTTSYVLKVSLNGGALFLYDMLVSLDGTGKLAYGVLPMRSRPGVPTLSYASISSYGTNLTGDPKKTELPLIQESKKTRMALFGTNLNEHLTRIRITDQQGVEWPIDHEPNLESVNHVVMVWTNTLGELTGIRGFGTHQLLEVILPRNVRTPSGDPMTFHYEVAVDGKNFDKTQGVDALVLMDPNDPGSRIAHVKKVTVSYRNERGDQLLPDETIKAYSFFRLKNMDLKVHRNLGGYQLIQSPSLDGTVGEGRELTYIYRSTHRP